MILRHRTTPHSTLHHGTAPHGTSRHNIPMTPENPEVNPKPAIGQLSVDAVILAKRLAKAAVGELVTYAELTALIGRNVQSTGKGCAYGVLQTARDNVMEEHEIVFETVPNEGLRRMTDSQISDSFRSPLRHIRRTAIGASKRLLCADTAKLSPEEQRRQSTGISVLGAMAQFGATSTQKAIEESMKPSAIPHKISVEDMVRLFAKK